MSCPSSGRSSALSRFEKYSIPLVVLVSIIAYANTLVNGFVWDDAAIVVQNPHIRSLGLSSLVSFFTDSGVYNTARGEVYRPLLVLSYAIDYKLFGLNPAGFHAVNVAFHAANSALVYVFASRLGGKRTGIAAGLVFAAHPIHTEAVSWIKDRDDLVAFFFMLLSIIWYLRAGRAGFTVKAVVLSLVFYFLSLLAKEMVITLPLLLVLMEFCFSPERLRSRRTLLVLASYFALTIGFLALRTAVLGQVAQGTYLGGGLLPTILTMTHGVGYYIRLLFLPISLSADYMTFPISHGINLNVAVYGAIVLGSLILCALAYRKCRVTTFAILWFFIALIPVSNLVPLKIPIAERFLYIPSAGFALIVGIAFARAMDSSASVRKIALCALVALVVAYTAGTIVRNTVWKDDFTLFSDIALKYPKNGTAHMNLAVYYYNGGDLDLALSEYEAAISANPLDVAAHEGLGSVYEKQGRLDLAISSYKTAVGLFSKDPADAKKSALHIYKEEEVSASLARALRMAGRVDEAISTLLQAKRYNPNYVRAYNDLAGLYATTGRLSEAATELKEALGIDPFNREARRNLASVYMAMKDCNGAVIEASEILKADPQDAVALRISAVCAQ